MQLIDFFRNPLFTNSQAPYRRYVGTYGFLSVHVGIVNVSRVIFFMYVGLDQDSLCRYGTLSNLSY